jgi:hypothetical protein
MLLVFHILRVIVKMKFDAGIDKFGLKCYRTEIFYIK